MSTNLPFTRRRFLRILGAASLTASLPTPAKAANFHWQGVVFGAEASLQLCDFSRKDAAEITKKCLEKAAKLEQIFSLFAPDSAIRKLNTAGSLENPPEELVEVLRSALKVSQQTQGVFDVSIQPLWRYLYYSDQAELQPAKIEHLQSLTDYRLISVEPERISFDRPGMEISLNGIAQGYITDQISQLLRSLGVENVLIDFGEFKAVGKNADAKSWQVGVQVPDQQGVAAILALEQSALATSSLYGLQETPKFRHIFRSTEPLKAAPSTRTLSVRAERAEVADKLSTALLLLGPEQRSALLRHYPDAEIVFSA